jgi:hypothetical protein
MGYFPKEYSNVSFWGSVDQKDASFWTVEKDQLLI